MAHADLRCTNCGDDLWCAMCGEPYQLPKGTRLIKVHGPAYTYNDYCDYHEADRCFDHPTYCIAACLDQDYDGCDFKLVEIGGADA